MADGVGATEASVVCSDVEKYASLGNTYVLIPLEDELLHNEIHISYNYPLSDKSIAKANLDQILSTFKFTD